MNTSCTVDKNVYRNSHCAKCDTGVKLHEEKQIYCDGIIQAYVGCNQQPNVPSPEISCAIYEDQLACTVEVTRTSDKMALHQHHSHNYTCINGLHATRNMYATILHNTVVFCLIDFTDFTNGHCVFCNQSENSTTFITDYLESH